jgi:hypothetical protein
MDTVRVPNLDFYAADDDWAAVVGTVFDLELFRVLQSDSIPGQDLREFHSAAEVREAGESHLMLFVVGAGPEPVARRIDLAPGVSDAGFRYTCEAWGLIQLCYGGFWKGSELRWTHTNHNSEKRATTWAQTMPEVGDPADWDWKAVTSASGKLNRAIRRMAVGKIGSHPVLEAAARLIDDANLRYEYGTGIHATPSFGSSRLESEARR